MPNINDPNPQTVYDRWLADLGPAGFSRFGNGRATIDRAPLHMEDLRHYFVGLETTRLGSSWVALVCEASQHPFRLGDIVRALIVVAVRLHGLKLPEEILLMPPNHPAPASVLAQPKTTIGSAARAADAISALGRELGGAPAAASGTGWEVQESGPLPPMGRKGTDPALLAAIAALGPLPKRIRLDGKKFGSVKVSKLIKDAIAMGGPADLTSFKAADGFRILHRKAQS